MRQPAHRIPWRIEGAVISAASSSRTIWSFQIYRWLVLALLFRIGTCLPPHAVDMFVGQVTGIAGTIFGYLILIALLLSTVHRRFRLWPVLHVIRLIVHVGRMLTSILLAVIPWPRRESQRCQMIVVQLDSGERRVVIAPASRAQLYVLPTDTVVFHGYRHRRGFQAVTGRNVTTGQRWGWL